MDRRKKLLWMFLLVVLAPGVAAVGHVFVSAWHNPANAGADLIRFDPSTLQVDQLAVLDRGDEGSIRVKFIVLKTKSGVRVFSILSNEIELFMPELRDWVVPGSGTCVRLDARNDEIYCLEPRQGADNANLWHWDYNGKNISGMIANLRRVNFNYDGDVITIGKR